MTSRAAVDEAVGLRLCTVTSPGLQPSLKCSPGRAHLSRAPMLDTGPTFSHPKKYTPPAFRMQAEPASGHLLWMWVGRTTSAMSSGILGSLAQTHDTAWGYSGLLHSQGFPTQPLCCIQAGCCLAVKFCQAAGLRTLTSLGVLYPSRRKRQQP